MKRHGSDVPGHGPTALAAATADSLPAQADALVRARAFAEPLLSGALLCGGNALGFVGENWHFSTQGFAHP